MDSVAPPVCNHSTLPIESLSFNYLFMIFSLEKEQLETRASVIQVSRLNEENAMGNVSEWEGGAFMRRWYVSYHQPAATTSAS